LETTLQEFQECKNKILYYYKYYRELDKEISTKITTNISIRDVKELDNLEKENILNYYLKYMDGEKINIIPLEREITIDEKYNNKNFRRKIKKYINSNSILKKLTEIQKIKIEDKIIETKTTEYNNIINQKN